MSKIKQWILEHIKQYREQREMTRHIKNFTKNATECTYLGHFEIEIEKNNKQ